VTYNEVHSVKPVFTAQDMGRV